MWLGLLPAACMAGFGSCQASLAIGSGYICVRFSGWIAEENFSRFRRDTEGFFAGLIQE
jgi:hypothetical protein